MAQNLLEKVTETQLRNDIPEFGPGSTVRVDVLIREGGKVRVQAFEGVVIKRTGAGIAESFTVRKISSGWSRTYIPLHSPIIDKITVLR